MVDESYRAIAVRERTPMRDTRRRWQSGGRGPIRAKSANLIER
jgi:hypothetical protein